MRELVLENKELRAVILPELGGKLRSVILKEKGFEAAAQPGEGKKYKKAERDGDFLGFDMSGIDDAFPNIDKETLTFEGKIFSYPDHGEIWSREMTLLSEGPGFARLFLHSERFGYDYVKTVSVNKNTVKLSYEISNRGDIVIPCIWTLHGLLAYRDDMRFIYPEGVSRFVNVLPGTPLGAEGMEFAYPLGERDFNILPSREKPYYVKYYCPDRILKGRCGVNYPSEGISVIFEYDSEELPWLGVWINGGGLSGDYNVALEMTSGYYDSVGRALENGSACLIKPGEKKEFNICLSLIS